MQIEQGCVLDVSVNLISEGKSFAEPAEPAESSELKLSFADFFARVEHENQLVTEKDDVAEKEVVDSLIVELSADQIMRARIPDTNPLETSVPSSQEIANVFSVMGKDLLAGNSSVIDVKQPNENVLSDNGQLTTSGVVERSNLTIISQSEFDASANDNSPQKNSDEEANFFGTEKLSTEEKQTLPLNSQVAMINSLPIKPLLDPKLQRQENTNSLENVDNSLASSGVNANDLDPSLGKNSAPQTQQSSVLLGSESEKKAQTREIPRNVSVEVEPGIKQIPDKITLHVKQENLGEITAKIQTVNQQSSILFVTETAETMNILAQHADHLKDKFHESQLALSHMQIEQQLQREGRQEQGKHPAYTLTSESSNNTANHKEPNQEKRRIESLLDTFA